MSTVSRSAEPLPCATHTPEQARITGSRAVTRPLAGWITLMPPFVFTCMYGSRLARITMRSPCRNWRRVARRRAGLHTPATRSRSCASRSASARTSRISGWNAPLASPDSAWRKPSVQSIHANRAAITVISAAPQARTKNDSSRKLRVVASRAPR